MPLHAENVRNISANGTAPLQSTDSLLNKGLKGPTCPTPCGAGAQYKSRLVPSTDKGRKIPEKSTENFLKIGCGNIGGGYLNKMNLVNDLMNEFKYDMFLTTEVDSELHKNNGQFSCKDYKAFLAKPKKCGKIRSLILISNG